MSKIKEIKEFNKCRDAFSSWLESSGFPFECIAKVTFDFSVYHFGESRTKESILQLVSDLYDLHFDDEDAEDKESECDMEDKPKVLQDLVKLKAILIDALKKMKEEEK